MSDELGFASLVHKAANEAIETHGGPKQLLMKLYENNASKATVFCTWMIKALPPQQEVVYHMSTGLQEAASLDLGTRPPLALHPCMFNFGPDCSVKPCPEMGISKRLVEEILQDGFISSAEPLLVFWAPEGSWPAEIPPKLLSTLMASQSVQVSDVITPMSVGANQRSGKNHMLAAHLGLDLRRPAKCGFGKGAQQLMHLSM